MRRHWRSTLLLAAGALSVAGCAVFDSSGDAPSTVESNLAAGNAALLDDFHDRYVEARLGIGSARQRHEIEVIVHDTVEGLVATCMAEVGFDYWPVPADNSFGEPSDIENPDWVAEYGFGIVELPDDVRAEDGRNFKYYFQLSESSQRSYDHALTGTDGQGGCSASARQHAATELGVPEVEGAISDMPSPLEHPDAQAIESEWRTCASAAGVDAPSVLAVTAELADELDQLANSGGDVAELQKREIQLATLTLECTQTRNTALAALTRQLYEAEVAG